MYAATKITMLLICNGHGGDQPELPSFNVSSWERRFSSMSCDVQQTQEASTWCNTRLRTDSSFLLSEEMQSPERHDLCLIWGKMSYLNFVSFSLKGPWRRCEDRFSFAVLCAVCLVLPIAPGDHLSRVGGLPRPLLCVSCLRPRCHQGVCSAREGTQVCFEDLSGPLPASCTQMDIRLIWFLLYFQNCFLGHCWVGQAYAGAQCSMVHCWYCCTHGSNSSLAVIARCACGAGS